MGVVFLQSAQVVVTMLSWALLVKAQLSQDLPRLFRSVGPWSGPLCHSGWFAQPCPEKSNTCKICKHAREMLGIDLQIAGVWYCSLCFFFAILAWAVWLTTMWLYVTTMCPWFATAFQRRNCHNSLVSQKVAHWTLHRISSSGSVLPFAKCSKSSCVLLCFAASDSGYFAATVRWDEQNLRLCLLLWHDQNVGNPVWPHDAATLKSMGYESCAFWCRFESRISVWCHSLKTSSFQGVVWCFL